MPAQSNGVVHAALRNGELSVDEERKYYCRNCGRFLMEVNIPIGTPGQARTTCPNTGCGVTNELYIGRRPMPRADRGKWLAARSGVREANRPSTSF